MQKFQYTKGCNWKTMGDSRGHQKIKKTLRVIRRAGRVGSPKEPRRQCSHQNIVRRSQVDLRRGGTVWQIQPKTKELRIPRSTNDLKLKSSKIPQY